MICGVITVAPIFSNKTDSPILSCLSLFRAFLHPTYFDAAAMGVIRHYLSWCLKFSLLYMESTISALRLELVWLAQTIRSKAFARYFL